MSDKTSRLLSLRPVIETEPASKPVEEFQNLTLRPILKLQNDLLVRAFQLHIVKTKNVFYKLSEAEKKENILLVLRQDVKFSTLLKGIVLGHFTEAEWTFYIANEQEINRRISNLTGQRLISNLANF